MRYGFYEKFFWATIGAILVIVLSLFFAGIARAETLIFSDNFYDYTVDTGLNNAPEWSRLPYGDGNSMVVSDNYDYYGSHSITATNTAAYSFSDPWASSTEGVMTFWWYADELPTGVIYITLYTNGDTISTQFDSDGKIYLEADSDPEVVASYTQDTWHKGYMQYDFTDNWIRFRMDEEDWSATTTIAGSSPTYIQRIGVMYAQADEDFYIDYIQVYQPTIDDECADYLTENECLENQNCAWWDMESTNPYITATEIFGQCVELDKIPAGFSTTTYAYITEADCIANGYCWSAGNCFLCDESMATTSAYAVQADVQGFIQNPAGWFETNMEYFDLRKKFPIGWVFQIYECYSDRIESFDSASSTDTIFTIDWTLNGNATTIPLLSFEYFTDASDLEDEIATIRQLLIYALWFAFVWKMWGRIKALSSNINKQSLT